MRRTLGRVFAVEERTSFAELPVSANAEELKDKTALLRHTAARLAEAGMDVLVADLSPPGGSGVRMVKMIVPGLEVETMSYHRVGERNVARLLGRQPTLAGVGDPPAGASRVPLTAASRERLGGEAWLNGEALDERMRDLYVLYREPSRHVTRLAMGER